MFILGVGLIDESPCIIYVQLVPTYMNNYEYNIVNITWEHSTSHKVCVECASGTL